MLRFFTSLCELINGIFQFISDWFRRREIEKATQNELQLQNLRQAVRLLAESEEVRAAQSKRDLGPDSLREDDGYRRERK